MVGEPSMTPFVSWVLDIHTRGKTSLLGRKDPGIVFNLGEQTTITTSTCQKGGGIKRGCAVEKQQIQRRFCTFSAFELDSSKVCLTSSTQAITGGAKGFLALDLEGGRRSRCEAR
ncbi:hypothetical protein M413DRAFT_81252 [Hebeloma cylindrosporum]|uniref:Uncharacterized protein n=1 Tax=Hebeloma cylindrosporum TaxID=76867 RepID=A0A0C2YFR6_HEBCY|nr:hypothetical protein M413DRAFT_81252 [Hebeloma cylindrosporum h7]